jgi:predicted ester cyclase
VSEKNKALVRRWFEEVWNQGREATIDELFPAEGVAHGLGDSQIDVHGPAEFKPFVANIRGSIPDIHIHLEDILCEGDRVVTRILLQGTHGGQGLGVAPTGRKVSIQGIVILRIVDGQIVEGWNSYDQLGLLRQTGALPGAGDRDRFLSAGQT